MTAVLAGLLPMATLQFLDSNGDPLVGGSVGFYIPNTQTLQTIWGDSAASVVLENPIPLGADGRPTTGGSAVQVFGSGQYSVLIYDSNGAVQPGGGLVQPMYIGEYVSETFTVGGALSSGIPTDVGSIVLTTGDWNVEGNTVFELASGASVNALICWFNTVSATQPATPGPMGQAAIEVAMEGASGQILPINSTRISSVASTIVYLGVEIIGTGTVTAGGFISARRVG